MSQGSLLPDSGFILPADFERLAFGGVRQCGGGKFWEVFLKASWASSSFFG
jgi:hypothetical protein